MPDVRGISRPRGARRRVRGLTGSLDDDDGARLGVDVASVDTGDPIRDRRLLVADHVRLSADLVIKSG